MGTGLSLLALGLTPDTMFLCPIVAAPSSWLITLFAGGRPLVPLSSVETPRSYAS